MHQKIIDSLFALYQEKGYVTEDRVFDALIENEIPLDEVDAVCEILLIKGIIIRNEIFEPEEDAFYDRSQLDYDAIFLEVVSIDNSLGPFIEDAKKIHPPQNREWKNMIVQAKVGNDFARQRIIEMYLRVVVKIALWHYKKYGISLSEAVQNGCLGLVTAYEKFALDKQDNFSTYASWWIRQYIMRGAQPMESLIYYPSYYKEKIFSAYEVYSVHDCDLCDSYFICPTLTHEIMMNLDCTKEESENLIDHLLPMKSIDEIEQINTHILSDKGVAEEAMIDNITAKERQKSIDVILSSLKPKEKKVIELRFGLIDGKSRTLEQVGKIFNVTRERIRQIESKAIIRLTNSSKIEKLKSFY